MAQGSVRSQLSIPIGQRASVTLRASASSDPWPTVRQFIGERKDSSSGLYIMGARYYNAYLNQWTQPDTMVPDSGNPQTLNRCAYALGNPERLRDPSGHSAIGPERDFDKMLMQFEEGGDCGAVQDLADMGELPHPKSYFGRIVASRNGLTGRLLTLRWAYGRT